MQTRRRKVDPLNYWAGVLGAVSYALGRFALSLDALTSALLGILGVALGIILANIIRKSGQKR